MAYIVDSSSEYNDMETLRSKEEIRPAVKPGSKRLVGLCTYDTMTSREEKIKKSTL